MIRLYLDQRFFAGTSVEISKEELRYFKSVRRGKGDVCLFNRSGEEAVGEFVENLFEIREVRKIELPLYDLRIALAIPEGAVIPGIIRAVSELGAKELILFAGDKSQSAKERLSIQPRHEKLALESARQCGRPSPLELTCSNNLDDLKIPSSAKVWFFDESECSEEREHFLEADCRSAFAIVGCEGGWTVRERDLARQRGFSTVHFKTPILRVETAVTAATFYAVERMRA